MKPRGFFLLPLLLLVLADANNFFLNSRKASRTFVNSDSTLKNGDEIVVGVSFAPQSKDGTVFTLFVEKDGVPRYRLNAFLNHSNVELTLKDEKHTILHVGSLRPIAKSRKDKHVIYVKLATGVVRWRLNEQGEENVVLENLLDIEGCRIRTVLGSDGKSQALIGCVELLAHPSDPVPLMETSVDVTNCTEDLQCQQMDCGEGKCFEFEVVTCDCYGTGKSGPNCKNPELSIHLDAENDTSLAYEPEPDDQQPHRLALSYKTREGPEGEGSEGVLLAAELENHGHLRIFFVGTKGNVEFGQIGKLNFTITKPNGFNHLRVDIDYKKRTFSLSTASDSEQQITWPETEKPVKFKKIRIGHGVPDKAQDVGFTGCMQSVYVDHLDVLYQLKTGDSRFSAKKEIDECPAEPVVLAGGISAYEKSGAKEELLEYKDRVHGADIFPKPAHSPKKPISKDECEKSESTKCRDGAKCRNENGQSICECPASRVGTFCQFTLLPRTCAEATHFGAVGGATKLDVDGSGPLSMSVADCRNSSTLIIHDMPPDTIIKSQSFGGHSEFVLSYRDFNTQKLSSLIRQSDVCVQHVSYECNAAPLNFAESRTRFFSAAEHNLITQMGSWYQYCGNSLCNCDASARAKDEGVMQNTKAGIISVVSLHSIKDISGRMTLGPLNCSGFTTNRGMRLQKIGLSKIARWTAKELSFQFRTSQDNVQLATILQQQSETFASIKLERSRFVVFSHKHQQISAETPHPLNDTEWHFFRLEIIDNDLFLKIDQVHKIAHFEHSRAPGLTVAFGDRQQPFLGCYRALSVDYENYDGFNFANPKWIQSEPSNFEHSCTNFCRPGLCQNEAKCVEDFERNAAKCVCKYPHIHSGENCELDLNKESDVSFHGGFLRFGETVSALTDQIIFSARTDQPYALLLFVHDEKYNFLQVHVSEEVNLTLTLNNENVAYSCTVAARPKREFSDMQWLQIVITHSANDSVLTVNEDSCTIAVPRKLSQTTITTFKKPFEDTTFVTMPVGLNFGNSPLPFVYTFVGGIERDTHSQKNETRLSPVYQYEVPDLLGCMRGLKIGANQIDLRSKLPASNLVRKGCHFGCENLNCKNGGHCSVAWKNYDPTQSRTTCDCSRTSYTGLACDTDDGLRFDGRTVLQFDIGEIQKQYLVDSASKAKFAQLFKFSFSSATQKPSVKTHLATIRFKDSRLFEVFINRNGSLHVGTKFDSKSQVLDFPGNFVDGYRHFFVAQFASNAATAIEIDSLRKDFEFEARKGNLELHQAETVEIGGLPEDTAAARNRRHEKRTPNFQGCISNVELDLKISELNYRPFALLGTTHKFASHVKLLGNSVKQVIRCASFAQENVLPNYQNTVDFPAWESNFKRHEYNKEAPLDEEANGHNFPSKTFALIIVLILIFFIIILLVIYCLCFTGKKNNKPDSKYIEVPTTDDLDDFKKKPLPDINNFNLPKPDIDLRRDSVPSEKQNDETPDNASWAASVDDDFDKTLTEGMDEGPIPTAQHGQELPPRSPADPLHRVNSFRNNRASPNAPLFSSTPNSRRTPIPVSPPTLASKDVSEM